jgi:FtsP/CotA-like multicopper oxidase with cupredoxin domain
MKIHFNHSINAVLLILSVCFSGAAGAVPFIQCPGDINADAVPDQPVIDPNTNEVRDIKCMHLAAGDGFVQMADGKLQYIFSFSDVTGVPEANSVQAGTLAANFSAPSIVLKEGQEFYLSLTNVGMQIRPDLFDPHTVHFHGFPNASDIFDGLPEATISINMGATLTYYYNIVEPGTYMYHCHVEATEHMQMGMLGNLYVQAAQNGTVMADPDGSGRTHDKFVYNDGDGSTGYDVEYPIQIGSFDPVFHDASLNVQPLPFADMEDTYPMLNGRGYPDTVDPRTDGSTGSGAGLDPFPSPAESGAGPGQAVTSSQPVSSLITANSGEKILLRISNLNVTRFYTLTALGLPMKVVGGGARMLRGPDGKDLTYETTSVTLGGGEARDVIIDTANVPPGTYFLYTTNLNYLSNNQEDFGGMMTEIHIL